MNYKNFLNPAVNNIYFNPDHIEMAEQNGFGYLYDLIDYCQKIGATWSNIETITKLINMHEDLIKRMKEDPANFYLNSATK